MRTSVLITKSGESFSFLLDVIGGNERRVDARLDHPDRNYAKVDNF